MIAATIVGLFTLMAIAFWMYCIVVQLENISTQLGYMLNTTGKKDDKNHS